MGEAALDIEMLAGLAPQSVIDVYQAPNNGNTPGHGFYGLFKKFVTRLLPGRLAAWPLWPPGCQTRAASS